ncbi:MAG: hypothetical protein QOF70_5962 [Acetobacteraceae bacterium]|nr:hypothetical protein [Acetobacteraceae bacterium]
MAFAPSKDYASAKVLASSNSIGFGNGAGCLWPNQVKLGKEKSESGGCAKDGRAISFGPYRLLAAQRLLLERGKPVRLGSRAFDILTALVERAGEVVGKAELIARAWPKSFVEEAYLKIQVSALRRALGDGQGDNRYVVTVVGRATISSHQYAKRSRRGPRRPRLLPRRHRTICRSRQLG